MTADAKDEKTLYIYQARANGKPLLSCINYCRSLGMTDEEIRTLFEEIFRNMEG